MTNKLSHRLRRALGIGVVVAAIGAFGLWDMGDHGGAQEVDENNSAKVTPDELELYIRVYTALQDDHNLAIETAIQPYHISLDDFRQLERRVQSEPRMVDRVREALLDHQKSRGAYARIVGTPTAAPRPERTAGAKPRP